MVGNGRLAVGVRLAAADGDEQVVFVARVGDVPPLERRGFRAAPPGHEEQPGDDAVDGRALVGAFGGLEPAAGAPPTEAGQHAPGGRPGRIRIARELGAQPRRDRRARGGAARLEQLGEVGGQARVVERAAAEPGVEAAQGAGVGAARVRADRGLGEPARRGGQRGELAPAPAGGRDQGGVGRRLWQLAGILSATIRTIGQPQKRDWTSVRGAGVKADSPA